MDNGVANLLEKIKQMNTDLGHIEEESEEDEAVSQQSKNVTRPP